MHSRTVGLAACVIMLCMMRTVTAGTPATTPAPCPESPNCVSSQAPPGDSHYIAPFSFSGPPEAALARLKAALQAQPRTRIVAEAPGYLHAEARSLIFRFVDDLEFFLEPGAGLIQIRSAARSGYYDFGVNRRRMERVRAAFTPPDSPP